MGASFPQCQFGRVSVRSAELLDTKQQHLSSVRSKPSVQDYSTLLLVLLLLERRLFESRWFFYPAPPPSLSVTHLYLSFSPDQRVIFLFPNLAMYSFSFCFSLSSPCFFFPLTGGNKISSSSHVVFSLPLSLPPFPLLSLLCPCL